MGILFFQVFIFSNNRFSSMPCNFVIIEILKGLSFFCIFLHDLYYSVLSETMLLELGFALSAQALMCLTSNRSLVSCSFFCV